MKSAENIGERYRVPETPISVRPNPPSPKTVAFAVIASLTLFPFVPSEVALISGIIFSLLWGNPFAKETAKLTSQLLQISIIGIGAGMNLHIVGAAGLHGLSYTAMGISLTVIIGQSLGRWFGTPRVTSLLLSIGTAICGGSAIAAVSSTIKAKSEDISVALATVFILNATALILFPAVGHAMALTPHEFGLWSALAIHDTSSVVGAAMSYHPDAVQIATTVKLARALWIIPVTFLVGWFWQRESTEDTAGKVKRPWFILGFLAAAAIVTYVPGLTTAGVWVSLLAKRSLVLTLFLIGAGLSRATLRKVGVKPFLHGFTLWVVVAAATLGAIRGGWIK